MKSGGSVPASMCSHVHEYGATVCISFSRYRLRAICIITTENELIFTTSPHVDIELWSWGSHWEPR